MRVVLGAIISSAIVATRPAAPGDPSFSRNDFSAATVSARIVSLSSGSAARTSFSTVTSRWISSGTICRPARILGIPIKSTPVTSIRPRI